MGLQDSTVTIILDGVEREMHCTIEAIVVMNKAYGGLMNLYDRVKAFDLEAFTVVVRSGLMLDGPEAEKLLETIFRTGMLEVQPAVSEFVLLGMTGGVRPKQTDDDKAGDKSEGKD